MQGQLEGVFLLLEGERGRRDGRDGRVEVAALGLGGRGGGGRWAGLWAEARE